MPADPSLFSIITSSHSNRLFRQNQEGLTILSSQIENLLVGSDMSPELFLGVQTFSSFELHAARYEELAPYCSRLVIFGQADVRPRPLPNTEFIGLPAGSALTRERFLILNNAGWQAMLLAQLLPETEDRLERQRQYQTVLTFSPQVIEQCAMLAGMLAGHPGHPVGRADTIRQQMNTARFVMQLVQLADAPNLKLDQALGELPVLLELAQGTITGANNGASVNIRLGSLFNQLRERLRSDVITLYRNERTMLRPVVSTNPLDHLKGIVVGQGSVGRAVEPPLGRFVSGAEAGAELGYGACTVSYALPVYANDDPTPWGVVAFGAIRPNAFQEAERGPLAAISGLIAGMIRSSPLAAAPNIPIAAPLNAVSTNSSLTTKTSTGLNPITGLNSEGNTNASAVSRGRIRLGGARPAVPASAQSTNGTAAEDNVASTLATMRAPDLNTPIEENPFESYQRRMISHLISFNRDAADRVWQEAYARFSARELCLNVLQPVQMAIGEGWHRGQVSVAAEHFSTNYCEGKLSGFLNSYPDNPEGATILTGCAQGELHATGMVMMSLFLRWEGYRVIYLGASVPNSTIADAVQEIKPDILCLSATMKENAYNLVETGQIVAKMEAAPIFCYGGLAFVWWPELRPTVHGIYLGDDPPTGLANIRRLIDGRRAGKALKERGQ